MIQQYAANPVTKDELTVKKLPAGGYLVTNYANNICAPSNLFASSSLEEAFKYIRKEFGVGPSYPSPYPGYADAEDWMRRGAGVGLGRKD